MEYDVDYFIAKFSAIPDEQWCVGALTRFHVGIGFTQHCVLGHCGMEMMGKVTDEANGLYRILPQAARINDGDGPYYSSSTPKARILAALNDVKLMRQGAK